MSFLLLGSAGADAVHPLAAPGLSAAFATDASCHETITPNENCCLDSALVLLVAIEQASDPAEGALTRKI